MALFRILVVRLGAMGDVVHALPAAATLKHSYPHSHLTWVIEPRWAPLLEGNPFVDSVLPFERSLAGVREAWRRLRETPFDLAVDFQGLIKSALVASMAKAARVVGFHASEVRERPAALFYSVSKKAQGLHVVDRNLELAEAAGATNLLRVFPLPPGRPEGELPEGDFVLADPLAGWASKQWPLERYGELAQRLRAELGMPLVVNGPPGERGVLESIRGAWVHVSGLAGLIHATRRAAAVVGVDSGPLHIAAALDKPGVAIFGPTDPARNGPYSSAMITLRDAAAATSYKRRPSIDDSMRAISVAQVFETLAAGLARRRAAGRRA